MLTDIAETSSVGAKILNAFGAPRNELKLKSLAVRMEALDIHPPATSRIRAVFANYPPVPLDGTLIREAVIHQGNAVFDNCCHF